MRAPRARTPGRGRARFRPAEGDRACAPALNLYGFIGVHPLRRGHSHALALRAPVFALGPARRVDSITFALRAPVFALGPARRVDSITFALRAPVFALGPARRAHAKERHARVMPFRATRAMCTTGKN